MPLSDPFLHTLSLDSVGEVVAAEIVSGCAEYVDLAVDALRADHTEMMNGSYLHKTREFATAAACFQMPKDRRVSELRRDGGSCIWSEGFEDAPRLTTVSPPDLPTSANSNETQVYLEWKLYDPDWYYTSVGVRLVSTASVARFASMIPVQNGRRGRLLLGGSHRDIEGVIHDDPFLLDLDRVFIFVRR